MLLVTDANIGDSIGLCKLHGKYSFANIEAHTNSAICFYSSWNCVCKLLLDRLTLYNVIKAYARLRETNYVISYCLA